jgi:hypothetical protein
MQLYAAQVWLSPVPRYIVIGVMANHDKSRMLDHSVGPARVQSLVGRTKLSKINKPAGHSVGQVYCTSRGNIPSNRDWRD